MSILDLTYKDVILTNPLLSKLLPKFAANKTVYEVLAELKTQLDDRVKMYGEKHEKVMETLGVIAAVYFFSEKYEEMIEVENRILASWPYSEKMFEYHRIAKMNLVKACMNTDRYEEASKIAEDLISNDMEELLHSEDDPNLQGFVESLVILNAKYGDEPKKKALYLEQLINLKDQIEDKKIIEIATEELLETYALLGQDDKWAKLAVEASEVVLIENPSYREGKWDPTTHTLLRDETANHSIVNHYESQFVEQDFIILLAYQQSDEIRFIKETDVIQEGLINEKLHQTIQHHSLLKAFEVFKFKNIDQLVWAYTNEKVSSSSTILLRHDLLEKLSGILDGDLMITFPTPSKVLITKYQEKQLLNFAVASVRLKTLNNEFGKMGSRDVFVYKQGSGQLKRKSFEQLIAGIPESDFKPMIKNAGWLKRITPTNKVPCICGSGKKFKSCCAKYLKDK